MTSHLGVMCLFAASIAIVFGTLMRDEPRDQRLLAAKIFGSLVAGGWVVGWLMYVAFA